MSASQPTADAGRIELGLRQNLPQFALLVAVNGLVGGMLGQERTVLPLLGEQEFGLRAYTAGLTFIAVFGLAKAATNYFAGTWSDRYGRKPVLVAGWLVAVPVPLMLIWAPSWAWVLVANLLLGISQGLTWSTTVVMKIDLVGPARRGFAMGLNEAAGYGAVAVTALATGYLADAYGLRPAPFLLGLAFAALGLGLSALAVHETRDHARLEAAGHRLAPTAGTTTCTGSSPTARCSRRPASASRRCPRPARPAWSTTSTTASPGGSSRSCSHPRGSPWRGSASSRRSTPPSGSRPARDGRTLGPVGPQVAHRRRDGAAGGRPGRHRARGLVRALGGRRGAARRRDRDGLSTLLAAIGDVAHPAWRARSVGIYRLWRDGGFAVGALLAGVVADALGVRAAVWVVAVLTAASGAVVAIRMYETRHDPGDLGQEPSDG